MGLEKIFAWTLEVMHPVSTLGPAKANLWGRRAQKIPCSLFGSACCWNGLSGLLSSAVCPAPSSNWSYSVILWFCSCRGCGVGHAVSTPARAGVVWICLIAALSVSLPKEEQTEEVGCRQQMGGCYLKWHVRKYVILHVLKEQRARQ